MDAGALAIMHWPDSRKIIIAFLRALYHQCPAFSSGREAQLAKLICNTLACDLLELDAIPTSDKAQRSVHEVVQLLPTVDYGTDSFLAADVYTDIVKNIQSTTGVKGKLLFKPIRAAMTGSADGPDLKQVICLVSIARLIVRVEYALCCSFLCPSHNDN